MQPKLATVCFKKVRLFPACPTLEKVQEVSKVSSTVKSNNQRLSMRKRVSSCLNKEYLQDNQWAAGTRRSLCAPLTHSGSRRGQGARKGKSHYPTSLLFSAPVSHRLLCWIVVTSCAHVSYGNMLSGEHTVSDISDAKNLKPISENTNFSEPVVESVSY